MKEEDKDIDLHKRFKRNVYDHALVATFTFSPRFFEEYMLERFKALQGKGGVTVFLDRGQYEEIIDATSKGNGWVPKLANRRYLLHPVSVPGVFHPKVFLLCTANRGLLVVGSANFSQDGLGGNAELVSVFEFEAGKKEEALPLFQSAFRFFEELTGRWPGKEVASNVDEVRRDAPWLTEIIDSPISDSLPTLLHNLDHALWPQIVDGLGPVDEISLVSRFFDSSPAILDSICKGLGTPKFKIHTQPKRGALTPDWLSHSFAQEKRLSIRLCQYGDGEHYQPLHAKGYALKSGNKTTLAIGSANFSTPALLRPAASGNVEAMLLYPPVSKSSLDADKLFDPLGSAKKVTHPEQLAVPADAEFEPTHTASSFAILLEEARLEEGVLILSTKAQEPGLSCRLSQANVASTVLPVGASHQFDTRLEPPAKWVRRMSESPTVAQLVRYKGDSWEAVSNPVLVAAIFDPETGKGARQSRRLREAVESPQRFMGVLRELCEGNDEAALKSFLANCNIPFDLTLRSTRQGRQRTASSDGPPTGFGDLGGRNLRHFEQLHDAAIAFARRHRSRLSRHVENGTARSIPNFLHILETLILLLFSQIERAKEGLTAEARTTLSADEWKEFREHLSEYYQEIEKLLELTVKDYLPGLHKNEPRITVHEAFGDTPETLLGICTKAIAARQDIAKALDSSVYVQVDKYTTQKARFFHTLLSDEKWKRYFFTLKDLAKELRKGVAA
jgi:HKD family nuclease